MKNPYTHTLNTFRDGKSWGRGQYHTAGFPRGKYCLWGALSRTTRKLRVDEDLLTETDTMIQTLRERNDWHGRHYGIISFNDDPLTRWIQIEEVLQTLAQQWDIKHQVREEIESAPEPLEAAIDSSVELHMRVAALEIEVEGLTEQVGELQEHQRL